MGTASRGHPGYGLDVRGRARAQEFGSLGSVNVSYTGIRVSVLGMGWRLGLFGAFFGGLVCFAA